MNNNINMIFYSQICPTCINIMTLLKNENLLSNFKVICVDNILDKFPPDMKVPLMRLVNVPEPLYAQSIYNWISQIKFMKQSGPNGNSIINTTQPQKKVNGPIGYDADIMSKISDSFAFSDKNINDPLPQSYFGINQEANNAIYTPPKEPSNLKIKKEEQKKILNEIEAKRAQQNNEFIQHSKQIQTELIMRDEYERQNTVVTERPVQNKPKKGITLIKH